GAPLSTPRRGSWASLTNRYRPRSSMRSSSHLRNASPRISRKASTATSEAVKQAAPHAEAPRRRGDGPAATLGWSACWGVSGASETTGRFGGPVLGDRSRRGRGGRRGRSERRTLFAACGDPVHGLEHLLRSRGDIRPVDD